MSLKNTIEGGTALLGNLFVWIAHSETIWFGMLGSYQTYLAPVYNLPDLRGPMAFATLLYVGLRLGDLWERREEVEDTL
ncbi:hypothetical protein [Halobellus ordinarius]|uniref:hypothetical protein n=1 Tax=Halobellus ordinarius TaxID=3075120 RepID=UPI0028802BF4|nr:hypothetical protein [Halobellus sp. ZY16]